VTDVLVVAGHALRESLRRRVFAVVVCLTIAFGGLYTWGASELFADLPAVGPSRFGFDARTFAGATILGLAMFGTLFLGVVLAVFLTLGAVRGDAERGLLQPLIVRPLGRRQYLAGRFLAAATVSAAYVLVVYGGAVVVTGAISRRRRWAASRSSALVRVAVNRATASEASVSTCGSSWSVYSSSKNAT
jgi:Cu-processing system permease protein